MAALVISGCSDKAALEKEIDAIVRGVDAGDPRLKVDDSTIGLNCHKYGDKAVVRTLETLYFRAESPERRAQIAAVARVLSGCGRRFEAWQDLNSLAKVWLFDNDSRVANCAFSILDKMDDPTLENLVGARLQRPLDRHVRDWILTRLALRGAFEVIRNELTSPLPEADYPSAVHDWCDDVRLALAACRAAAAMGIRLPSDFGPLILSLAAKHNDIMGHALGTLVRACPEEARVLIGQSLGRVTQNELKLALQAAQIALEDPGREVGGPALTATAQAASRYRAGEECWPELKMRTRWLAFAAAYSRSDALLPQLWSSLDGLHLRDRAELLWVIVCEFLKHGPRSVRDRFLLFRNGVEPESLRQMIYLYSPQLGEALMGMDLPVPP
jgi:hypothetical protein